jgi:hypothetical protein
MSIKPKPEELADRFCGYCGKMFHVTQDQLIIHLDQCEKDHPEIHAKYKDKLK